MRRGRHSGTPAARCPCLRGAKAGANRLLRAGRRHRVGFAALAKGHYICPTTGGVGLPSGNRVLKNSHSGTRNTWLLPTPAVPPARRRLPAAHRPPRTDAHAERNGGHHHLQLVPQEGVVHPPPLRQAQVALVDSHCKPQGLEAGLEAASGEAFSMRAGRARRSAGASARVCV